MKRSLIAFLLIMIVSVSVFAQQKSDDADQVVTVPKKYVSAEGLSHQVESAPQKVSQWIGVGQEIGIATREGLNAVVDTAEKFGTTKVGTFVMVMIAWKIMAKEVLGVILGIPLLIAGVSVWFWVMKRLFFGYRVLEKKEGHTKFYTDHPPYKFVSSEARSSAGTASTIVLLVFVLVMIGAVIF